jgi:polysaccharide biosynthesis transport protein
MTDFSPPPTFSSWSANFFTKLHRYRALVKRRWYVPILAVSIGLCIEAYQYTRIAPQYVSSGKLMISPRVNLPQSSMINEEFSNFFGTQIKLMQSNEVLERARARVQALKPDLPPCGVAFNAYQEPRTSIFVVQGTGSEPVYTQAYIQACMEEYINRRKETRTETSQTALTAITEQLVKTDKEISQIEDDMLNFQKQNNVILLEEQGSKNASYLVTLNNQLSTLNTEYQLLSKLTLDQNIERDSGANSTQSNSATATSTNAPTNPTGDNSSGSPVNEYQQANQQILLLEVQRNELAKLLKPKHPKMIAIEADIQRQRTLLDMFKQQSQDQLNNRREILRLQIENLKELIKNEEVKALDVSRRTAEYQRLKAKDQRLLAQRETLMSSINNVSLSQSIDQEYLNILENATPATTIRASMSEKLIHGFFMGLAAGIAILVLLDRIDDRINSFSELRNHFDEPVLGQIPLDSETTHHRRGESTLLIPDDHRHIYAESYRNVRSSLLFMAIDGTRPKSLLITSAIPNEGKSSFSSNLAITMALAGSRVLLIDADLRRGRLHEAFQVSNTGGLSEVLSHQIPWQNSIVRPANYALDIIPRGTTPPNPGELFLSPSTTGLFAELRDAYDYLVVDSAPILATDDTASLAPCLDGTLFITRTSYTSARLSRNALDLLYQRQIHVLGLIMNFVDTNLPEYYYYQYKEYYSRGNKTAS